MPRTSPARTVPRRARRPLGAVLSILSMAALGCTASAEAPDSQARRPSSAGQGLTQNGVDVTPAAGDSTRATLDVDTSNVDAAHADDTTGSAADDAGVKVEKTDGGWRVTLPGMPPFVLGGDDPPNIADVTRTDVSHGDGDTTSNNGPRVLGVTRTDHSAGANGAKAPNPFDGKVVVKPGKDQTLIEVPGFPALTLKPDGKGGIVVTMPGSPPFTVPAGTVIEAPGGLSIQR